MTVSLHAKLLVVHHSIRSTAIAVALLSLTHATSFGQTGKLVFSDQPKVKKLDAPVVANKFPKISGDPAILKDGNIYRLFFTAPNLLRLQGAIAESVSTDLMTWTPVNAGTVQTGRGLVLLGRPGKWDEQLETAYVIKDDGKYFLYYCGYPKIGWPAKPGQIGVATSIDAVNFQHASVVPVLATTANGYDSHGLYSPVVIKYQNKFLMIYAGHCYSSNTVTPGIYLLTAISMDGLTWEKNPTPLLSPNYAVDWLKHGVAEPAICTGPNGEYYLFFTANLGDDQKRCIGVGRSDTPMGPYEISSQPILRGTPGWFDEQGVLAPHVIADGAKLRMWYLANRTGGPADEHMIGYAEMPWPPEGFNDVLP